MALMRRAIGPVLIRGVSLLENAVLLPLVLATVVGVIDLNTVLQGYTALHTGVDTALRCAYPVDGACVSSEARLTTFDWFKLTRALRPDPVSTVDYAGTARLLLVPSYEIIPTVRVLDRGSAAAGPSGLTLTPAEYQASGETGVVILRAFLPGLERALLTEGVSSDNPRLARMVYPGDKRGSYPPRLSVGVRGSKVHRGLERSDDLYGYTDYFRVPFPDFPANAAPSGRCYLAQGYNRSNVGTTPQFESACGEEAPNGNPGNPRGENPRFAPSQFTPTSDEMYIALDIDGSNNRTGSGALKLTLEEYSGGLSRPVRVAVRALGGQHFGNEGADFFPRGVPLEYIPSAWQDRVEFNDYQAIRVRRDPTEPQQSKLYRLRFHLVEGNHVSWQATAVRVYTPVYATVRVRKPCAERVRESERVLGSYSCNLAEITPPYQVGMRNGSAMKSGESVTLGGAELHDELGQRFSDVLSEEEARRRLRPVSPWSAADYVVERTPGATPTVEWSCPENSGVATPADSSGLLPATEAAVALCPPPPGVPLSRVSYSERVKSLPPIEYEVSDCRVPRPGELGWALPEALASYPKLALGEPRLLRYTPRSTGTEAVRDPLELITSPKFECADVRVRQVRFDRSSESADPRSRGIEGRVEDLFVEADTTSVFSGERPELQQGCRDLVLSADAAKLGAPFGVDRESFFVAEQKPVGRRPLAEIGVSEGMRRCIATGSTSEVVVAREAIATALAAGSTPPLCVEDPAACERVFHGFSSDGAQRTGQGVDIVLAQAKGVEALQATYPRARTACNPTVDTECVRIEPLGSSAEADAPLIEFRAQMQVPLVSTALFGIDRMPLSYVAGRRKEWTHLVAAR